MIKMKNIVVLLKLNKIKLQVAKLVSLSDLSEWQFCNQFVGKYFLVLG